MCHRSGTSFNKLTTVFLCVPLYHERKRSHYDTQRMVDYVQSLGANNYAMVKIIPMPHAQRAGLWLIGNHATELHPFCYDHGFYVTDQYKKCNDFETFPK